MKVDKILDMLLIYMKNTIEECGKPLNIVIFDFSFHKIPNKNMNGSERTKDKGKDLIAFKKETKLSDELIDRALKKALVENYIKYSGIDQHYEYLVLTMLGSARAESVKHNQKNVYKRWLNYFAEKLLLPVIVGILVAIVAGVWIG